MADPRDDGGAIPLGGFQGEPLQARSADLLNIEHYLDADGLVAPRQVVEGQRNASGNGLSYTALYYVVAVVTGLIELPEARDKFRNAVLFCFAGPTGLLNRAPTHPDQNSWDDYASVLAACAVLGEEWTARRIKREGEKRRDVFAGLGPKWWMNNEQWLRPDAKLFRHPDGRVNWSAWIGRFPFIPVLAKLATLKPLNLWDRIKIAAYLYTVSNRPLHGDADAWRIGYLVVQALESALWENSILIEWAIHRVKLAAGDQWNETQAGYFELGHPLLRARWTP